MTDFTGSPVFFGSAGLSFKRVSTFLHLELLPSHPKADMQRTSFNSNGMTDFTGSPVFFGSAGLSFKRVSTFLHLELLPSHPKADMQSP